MSQAVHDPTPPLEILVIGGSAGALEVLLEMLPGLPRVPGGRAVPIVIVVHLAPNRPSLLPTLLARVCARPVCEVEDKQPLEAGAIFVAPPNYHVLVERRGHLALSVDEPVQFSRPSIDVLFESAADALGPGVAGVVLSGANEDGARGLQHIVAAGGRAAVQDPATALHPEMPAAAARLAGGAPLLSIAALTRWCAALPGPAILRPGARP